MSIPVLGRTPCYASEGDLATMFPDTATLSVPDRERLLLYAQQYVDYYVGFHIKRRSTCQGQDTIFPRCKDCCCVEFCGAIKVSELTSTTRFTYFNIGETETIGTETFTAGEWILMLRDTAPFDPLDTSSYKIVTERPSGCYPYILWEVNQAALIMAGILFEEDQSDPLGGLTTGSTTTTTTTTGDGSSCLPAGMSIKVGGIQVSQSGSSSSSSTSSRLACCSVAFSSGLQYTKQYLGSFAHGRRFMSLLDRISNWSFAIP